MFDSATAFSRMSCGDLAAESFCHALFTYTHTLDDLIDRDQVVTPESAALTSLRLIHAVAGNLFFQKHKDTLLPVLNMAVLAWIESERFNKHDQVLERIVSQALKSQYLDVFLTVAWITGGAQHALNMSREYRDYSFDPV